MILESVTLSNWKAIPCLTVNLTEGINILYGPNEIGKSTLLEAIHLGLTGEVNSSAALYKDIVPWNTKVKAHITLLLRNNKKERYVIKKSFPKGDATLFFVNEDNTRHPIAEGREVNNMILQKLGIEENLNDLVNLLWIKQGEALNLFNPKREAEKKLVTGGLKQKIGKIIKQKLASPIAEEFFARIKNEYDDYFQQSGKFKTGRGSAGKQVRDLESEKHEIQIDIGKTEKKLEETREITEILKSIDSDIKETEAQLKENEREKNLLNAKKKEWDALQRLHETYTPLRNAYNELIQLNSSIETVRKELPAAYAKKKLFIEERIKEIDRHLALHREKKELLEARKKELSSYKPIKHEIIDEVIEREQSLKTLSVQLEKTQMNLSITPEKELHLTLRADDTAPRDLSLSKPEIIKANQSAEIIYPGHFTVSVTGPLGEKAFKKLTHEKKIESEKCNMILSAYGVSSGKELREYYNRYRECSAETTRLEEEIQSCDSKKLEEEKKSFTQEAEREKNQLELFTAGGSTDIPSAVQKITTLREIEQYITKREGDDQHLSRRRKKILGEMSYEDFEAEVMIKKREIEEKTKQVEQLEPKEIKEVPDTMIEKKENMIRTLRNRLSGLKEKKAGIAGRLTEQDDLEARLHEQEYRLRLLEKKLTDEYKNAGSISLLLDLIEKEKSSRETETVQPIQERVTNLFEQLTKGKYSGFRLDTDFKPLAVDARVFDNSSFSFDPSLLSIGTQEQLSFLFRLSLASKLSEEETQIMALDDSFVNTDPIRLSTLFSLISEAKPHIQFLIFTCNKQNFEKFSTDCAMIDLVPHLRTT